MSYYCQISFKEIEAEDIQDFFLNLKKKARERFEQAVEDNYMYSPMHKDVFYKNPEDITPELYSTKYQTEQQDWTLKVYTYRWFYLKEHNLLGVFGVGNELKDCFDSTLSFQNSCDQDYDFDYWDNVKLFKDIAEKHKNDTWEEVDPENDYEENERTDNNLEYLRKSAAYGEIWDNYLDDKLYDRDTCVFVSLFSPFYDDLTFISKFSIHCYKKTMEQLETFKREIDKINVGGDK